MSQPKQVNLTKGQMKKVLSAFNGTKKREGVKSAKKIASDVGVPYRQVMLFLEDEGLRWYSPGSYA